VEGLQEETLDVASSEGIELDDTNLPYKLAQTTSQTWMTDVRINRLPQDTNYKLLWSEEERERADSTNWIAPQTLYVRMDRQLQTYAEQEVRERAVTALTYFNLLYKL
jgi:hypothetical protein